MISQSLVYVPAFPADRSRNVFHICLFVAGSMPVEYSSINRTLGLPLSNVISQQLANVRKIHSPIKEIARASFLWFPPLNLLAGRLPYSPSA